MVKICLYTTRYECETMKLMPLGVGYVSAYLIQQGYVTEKDILIVDDIDEAIEFKPDILGVSAVTQLIDNAIDFAKICKEKTDCLAVLGGYHITCIPNELPEPFDIGVLSEGEITFAKIVSLYKDKKITTDHLAHVKGICYRKDGDIKINDRREFIENIDSLPRPYRYKEYSKEIPIFTSRGCPYKCIFCASHNFWGDKFRLRSAESVIAEIEYLVNKYQPEEIVILDDLWMANKNRFKQIVEKLVSLRIPEKVRFRGFCRSNIIEEEDIILLKKMNYRMIRFGAETGSDRLLKRLKGPNISIQDHQRVIDLSYKHDIPCGASFMFGIPGETMEDLQATIMFLRKNKGKLKINGFYFYNPIPGTELWNWMEQQELFGEDFQFNYLQLDFLKENFSWETIPYFNEINIPLGEFKNIINQIRAEFIDKPLENDTLNKRFKRLVQKIKGAKN